MAKKILEELPTLCDNRMCDEKGDRARCYLEKGEGNFHYCEKYKFWRDFQERHYRAGNR